MAELLLECRGNDLTVTLGETTGTLLWSDVAPAEQTMEQLFTDACAYGHRLFTQLFCTDELLAAVRALPAGERLMLVAEDPFVASLPWEYLRDPASDSLLAGKLNMVRGLPREQRRAPSAPQGPLHLLAVPVSPLNDTRPLNTEQEWKHLLTAVTTPVSGTPKQLSVLRVRPPTLSQVERSLPGQGNVIVHFMGHSGHTEHASVLVFEDALGWSAPVTAEQLAEALDAHVQLVLLNSCLSATVVTTDRATEFGNLARTLVRQGVPYALGMQFVLPDEAALALSQAFYDFLLQGRSIEEAVRRTRRDLDSHAGLHQPHWLAGLPVLYTCLRESAPPVQLLAGQPQVHPDPQALEQHVDLTALPEMAQVIGRGEALRDIFKALLAPVARGFVLLHGMGGIGKTTLALAAATRASWYYGDRVLAHSFETFASFDAADQMTINETFAATFLNRLARFYDLDPSEPTYQATTTLQEAILRRRSHTRSLLVLDNLETLLEAHRRGHTGTSALMAFLRRLREGDGAVLLTSRVEPPADWQVQERIPIQGISTEAGAELFLSLLPVDRRPAAPQEARQALSKRVQGHPLGIRLLAGQFADEVNDLATFLAHVEEELAVAEQHTPTSLYDAERQKTLYACLDYSVKHLTETQRQVLHACSLFQSQFLPTFASTLFENEEQTLITLQELQRLSLLEQNTRTFPEGTITLLELHAMTRWYLQHRFPTLPAEWDERYGQVYAQLARQADQPEGGYDQNAVIRFLIRQSLPDCEVILRQHSLPPQTEAALTYHLAKPYERLGQVQRALALREHALECYQELGSQREIAVTQHAIANLLVQQGKVSEALALYEQSLQTNQDVGDVRSIAVTQHAIANLLVQQGKVSEALALYEQSLQTNQDVGDVRSIAVTQHAIADLLVQQGKVSEALALYEQSLQTDQALGDMRGIAVTQANLSQILFREGNPQRAIALAWDAYTGLYQHGFLPDAQQMQGILMAMKAGDVQRFDALWEATLKEPQPAWLHEVQPAPSHRQGGIASEQLRVFVANTIAVMTAVPEKHTEWRATIVDVLQQAQAKQAEHDSAFFAALLALLAGQPSLLPDDHPYADALTTIKEQIATYDPQEEDETPSVSAEIMQAIRDFVNAEDWKETRHVLEERQQVLFQPEVESIFLQNIAAAQEQGQQRAVEILQLHLGLLRACKEQGIAQAFEQFLALQALPFDPELIPRSITALKKGSAPQERMAYAQYLATVLAQSEDAGTKQLVATLQLALFGGDLTQLGSELHGIYRQVWERIMQQATNDVVE